VFVQSSKAAYTIMPPKAHTTTVAMRMHQSLATGVAWTSVTRRRTAKDFWRIKEPRRPARVRLLLRPPLALRNDCMMAGFNDCPRISISSSSFSRSGCFSEDIVLRWDAVYAESFSDGSLRELSSF